MKKQNITKVSNDVLRCLTFHPQFMHDLKLETYFYYSSTRFFVMYSLPNVCKFQIHCGFICFELEEVEHVKQKKHFMGDLV